MGRNTNNNSYSSLTHRNRSCQVSSSFVFTSFNPYKSLWDKNYFLKKKNYFLTKQVEAHRCCLWLGPCHITRKTDHLNSRVYFHKCQCLLLIAKGNSKPTFLSHLSCSYRSILHTTVQSRNQGGSRVWSTRYWTVHQKTYVSQHH